jgi:hypothetical protein
MLRGKLLIGRINGRQVTTVRLAFVPFAAHVRLSFEQRLENVRGVNGAAQTPVEQVNADDPTQERIQLLQQRFDLFLVTALDLGKEFLQFPRGHVRCPLSRARTMQRFGGSSPQPIVTPVTRNGNDRSRASRRRRHTARIVGTPVRVPALYGASTSTSTIPAVTNNLQE